jgi:hypothetical protein
VNINSSEVSQIAKNSSGKYTNFSRVHLSSPASISQRGEGTWRIFRWISSNLKYVTANNAAIATYSTGIFLYEDTGSLEYSSCPEISRYINYSLS